MFAFNAWETNGCGVCVCVAMMGVYYRFVMCLCM